MNELPSGWAMTTISDITEYLSRGKQPKYTNYSSLPVINQKSIRWFGIQNEHLKYVDPVQFDQWEPERFIQSGDLLWNSTGRGTLGRASLVKQCDLEPRKVVDSHVTIVRPNQAAIDPRFLFSWIQSSEVQENITSLATGATNQIELSRAAIASMRIPIAPLNEQKRIADKLDSLLARVDACRDRLERVSHILERFRQAVITAAISGELTDDWVNTNNYEGWQEAVIGDLLIEKPRNGYSPRPVNFETETQCLTLTATTSGKFNPAHIKYINEKIPEDSYLWLKPNDILIQRANTLDYVGVSAIYDGLPKQYIYPDLIMKCRANDRVLTKFLYYLLSSNYVRSYFRQYATGTSGNMPKINQKTVVSAPVSVPSIDEQQEIVGRVDRLFAYADRLDVCYRQACTKVEKLQTTLLDKAFRGELVPQDPTDEPASVLLERIKSEKRHIDSEQQKKRNLRRITNNKNNNKKKQTTSMRHLLDDYVSR